MDIEKIEFHHSQFNHLNEILDTMRRQLVNSIILAIKVAQAKPETPVDLDSLKEAIAKFCKTFVLLERERNELVKAIKNYQSQVDELKKAYTDLKQENYELQGFVPLSFRRKEF